MEAGIAPYDIVGLAEIEDRTRVPMREVVTEWWPNPDFPRPMKILSLGPIWYWPAVVAWIERTRGGVSVEAES